MSYATIDLDPPMVTLSPTGPIRDTRVGDTLHINCTANTMVAASLLTFIWNGPGGNITNGSRVTISTTISVGNNTYVSTLQFAQLTENDGGVYTCYVEFFNVSGSDSIIVDSPDCEY